MQGTEGPTRAALTRHSRTPTCRGLSQRGASLSRRLSRAGSEASEHVRWLDNDLLRPGGESRLKTSAACRPRCRAGRCSPGPCSRCRGRWRARGPAA
ncbi:hypothetical protein C0Q98_08335 [Streptomyces albidoflavus]|nr:hypothetical protein C0Q93_07915 [Streptomyces albidoflavus]RZE31089.1 hypothetical protein C0Q96_07960 [Streptomyces albidoflavus]RZE47807.1 hypothetical protein C0Q94_07920 [Streptomyces albidoflavus]RZE62574.1 hypothetical protein C0Q98_08335 [Streptomyces albidoflavus]